MRERTLFIVLGCLLLTLAARSEETLHRATLKETIEYALNSSFVLEEAEAALDEKNALLEESLAPGRPQLSVQATGNYTTPIPQILLNGRSLELGQNWNYNARAALRQSITDFGRTHFAYQAARSEMKASEAQKKATHNLVAFTTARAFYETEAARRLMEVSEKEVEARQELLRSSEAKVKEGAAARYDLVRSRAALARAQADRVERETEFLKRRSVLWSLAGQPVVPELDWQPPSPPDDFLVGLASALHRPDLERLRMSKRAQGYRTERAAAENNPTLALTSDYTRQNPVGFQLDQQWRVGLEVQIPIYDGGATRARVAQGKAREKQLEAGLNEAERKVSLEVEQDYQTLLSSLAQLEPTALGLLEAQEAHRLSRLRYEVGLSTLLELLDTRAELTAAQVRNDQAELSYRLAWCRWIFTTDQWSLLDQEGALP